ncbi:MAG: DUF4623 domain-containing protein [Verrucomicrobia bacterium]|nr:DUF4623 domain-containing protein [Verrucomicrobiota bacterium]
MNGLPMKCTRLSLALVRVVAVTGVASSLAQGIELRPLWSLAPGDTPFLTANDTERGLAYNPATGQLLVASRAAAEPNIYRLDPATGGTIAALDMTGISGGTFAVNMIGAADDGAIYAANLSLNGTTDPFRLYRWANATAAPVLVFSGNPGATGVADRWGDSLAVWGAGDNTQVLIGSRTGTLASLFRTSDGGTTFTPQAIATDAVGGDFGLSVAFSDAASFWGTARGRSLRSFSLDGAGSTATTLGNFGVPEGIPAAVSFIGVDPANRLLAGIELVPNQADVLRLWDISTGSPQPLDQQTLPVNNDNVRGTGAIDFASGTVFVLNTENGLHAYAIVPEPGTASLLLAGGALFLWCRRARRA